MLFPVSSHRFQPRVILNRLMGMVKALTKDEGRTTKDGSHLLTLVLTLVFRLRSFVTRGAQPINAVSDWGQVFTIYNSRSHRPQPIYEAIYAVDGAIWEFGGIGARTEIAGF